MGLTAGDWLDRALERERVGDHLQAFDLAERGLAHHPHDVPLQHRAALALARLGATEAATARALSLRERAPESEDVAALVARLAKDRARSASAVERAAAWREAAIAYEGVAGRPGGSAYPAINAATAWRFAGEEGLAGRWAAEARRRARIGRPDYWCLATLAEAALLEGDLADVHALLGAARAEAGGDYAALGTTRAQLAELCRELGVPEALLDPLRPPSVAHYTGHRAEPAGSEGELRERVDAVLEARGVGFGFGALASGADLIVAEALLARGARLAVVLPFAPSRFVSASVAPAGEAWVRRFERCLAAADEVFVTEAPGDPEDAVAFAYASRQAMGLAVLRARRIGADVAQIAVWDGREPTGLAGTAADVTAWRATGLPQEVLTLDRPCAPAAPTSSGRALRALLFGDVKGFGGLREHEIPAFFEHVMGAIGGALEPFDASIRWRNTWGDGLYLVLDDVGAAARCALALQSAVRSVPCEDVALPPVGLRLGLHVGPVTETFDSVLRRMVPCGVHVTRTARIEPITPVGRVYVSEAFATALALTDAPHGCAYVGVLPLPKGAGELRMYLLEA